MWSEEIADFELRTERSGLMRHAESMASNCEFVLTNEVGGQSIGFGILIKEKSQRELKVIGPIWKGPFVIARP